MLIAVERDVFIETASAQEPPFCYNASMVTIHRTYQYRAYASKAGYSHIRDVLRECAQLYNAALQEWSEAYRKFGITITISDQLRQFTQVRQEDEFWGGVSVQVGRGALKRLDRARQAFYRRVKAGQTPGYPRYKSRSRWNTMELAEVNAGIVKQRGNYCCIRVKGLPDIKLRKGQALPGGELKALSLTLRGRRLFVNMAYAIEQEQMPATDKAIGIDMGVSDRLTLSNGESVQRRRKDGKIKRAQQRLSRCKKGSHRWRKRKAILANAQERERVSNRNECHRITTALIRRYGIIAVENLAIKNMTRSAKGTKEKPGKQVAQKRGLNREITAQTWGIIRQQLAYKAEWAGRELLIVNPRHTSQTCSRCGRVDANARRKKRYNCPSCGLSIDADVNAAVNILHRGLAGRLADCEQSSRHEIRLVETQ